MLQLLQGTHADLLLMLVLLEPRMAQGLAGRDPLVVVAIQHLEEQVLGLLGKTEQRRLRGNVFIIDVSAGFHLVPASKRRDASEQDVHEHPTAPDIRPINEDTLHNLGRQVGESARNRIVLRYLLSRLDRSAEINDLDGNRSLLIVDIIQEDDVF